MKRLALFILVALLLTFNLIVNKMSAGATPYIMLFGDLPLAMACAGLFIAALGMGAQFWLCALPISGATWSPKACWGRLSIAGLCCGWLPVLCAMPYTENAGGGLPSSVLLGCFSAHILIYLCSAYLHSLATNVIGAVLTSAIALLCGILFRADSPMAVLVHGLMGAISLHLLTARDIPRPLVWLYIAGLLFCAYVAAFGSLLITYPPGDGSSPWGMPIACGFTLCALLLVIFAPLRHSLVGLRSLSILGLALNIADFTLHSTTSTLLLLALLAIPFLLYLRAIKCGKNLA